MMNLNQFAKEVCKAEGGKQNLSIAQVKEVIRIALQKLSKEDPLDVLVLLRKIKLK